MAKAVRWLILFGANEAQLDAPEDRSPLNHRGVVPLPIELALRAALQGELSRQSVERVSASGLTGSCSGGDRVHKVWSCAVVV